jgi:hypothetical protein
MESISGGNNGENHLQRIEVLTKWYGELEDTAYG